MRYIVVGILTLALVFSALAHALWGSWIATACAGFIGAVAGLDAGLKALATGEPARHRNWRSPWYRGSNKPQRSEE